MSTDIPKTQTLESIALENAMSGKVRNIENPGPHWVELVGSGSAFDLNSGLSNLVLINTLKELSKEVGTVTIKLRRMETWGGGK